MQNTGKNLIVVLAAPENSGLCTKLLKFKESSRGEAAIAHQRGTASHLVKGSHQKGDADSKRVGAKTKSNPACDKHPNLQMEGASFMTPAGRIFSYICPVPSCGRRYDGKKYLEGCDVTYANQENASNSRRTVVDCVSGPPLWEVSH